MNLNVGYIGIVFTVFFTVYSQIVIKWQVNMAGELPSSSYGKIQFLLLLLINPWVISSILATLGAGLSWMLVMSKFDLSYAYPFVSLVYVFMMLASVILFNESISLNKFIGVLLIMIGIVTLTRG